MPQRDIRPLLYELLEGPPGLGSWHRSLRRRWQGPAFIPPALTAPTAPLTARTCASTRRRLSGGFLWPRAVLGEHLGQVWPGAAPTNGKWRLVGKSHSLLSHLGWG